MKVRRLFAVVACLPMVLGAAILYGAFKAPPKPEIGEVDAPAVAQKQSSESRTDLEQQLRSALQMRTSWAQQALEATQAAHEADTATLGELIHAANQLIDAEVANAPTKVQRLAALEKHLERMEQTASKINALYKSGSKGGEAVAHRTINRECENAKVKLLKARLEAE